MAFDAAQRRLLTAAAGGVVQLFNPHSGAELRRFEAPQRRRGRGQGLGQGPEITAVARQLLEAAPQEAGQASRWQASAHGRQAIAAVLAEKLSVDQALESLLTRPIKSEG